jgi:hypothetical protein
MNFSNIRLVLLLLLASCGDMAGGSTTTNRQEVLISPMALAHGTAVHVAWMN